MKNMAEEFLKIGSKQNCMVHLLDDFHINFLLIEIKIDSSVKELLI